MSVAYVDLGTTRTAIAIHDGNRWTPAITIDRRVTGAETSPWELQALRDAILRAAILRTSPMAHFVLQSRYCSVQGLTVPAFLDGPDVALPPGAMLLPRTGMRAEFESVKGNDEYRGPFVAAVQRYVTALAGARPQWVVGRSSGLRQDLPGLPGNAKVFNEAVAVIYALMSDELRSAEGGSSGQLSKASGQFVLLADLGGGFLDICVADDLKLEDRTRDARIVNFGGYPLGVDRISPRSRFSESKIDSGADTFLRLIALAIQYHVSEYRRQSAEHAKRQGTVLLTGGGFERLDPRELRLDDAALTVRHVSDDTKYLTLLGLREMDRTEATRGAQRGEDLTHHRVQSYGGEVLKDFARRVDWAAPTIAEFQAGATWFGILDNLRHKHVDERIQ